MEKNIDNIFSEFLNRFSVQEILSMLEVSLIIVIPPITQKGDKNIKDI